MREGRESRTPGEDVLMYRQVGLLATSVMITVASLGCARPDAGIQAAEWRLHDVRRNLALETFDLGVFYKPREGSAADQDVDLAPLIIQEVAPEAADRAGVNRFGALVIDEHGTFRVELSRPTVYTATSSVTIGGVEHDQVVYVWFYPPGEGSRNRTDILAQGIRMTLSAEGFPLVWEVLASALGPSSSNDVQVLFVSRSLERLAAEIFGPAMAHRRYAVERRVAEAPNTVVVRVIEDGPIPMGPYVYLSADTHGVTTLLCRCSPSQVDRFLETTYYELESLEYVGTRCLEAMVGFTWAASAGGPNRLPTRQTNARHHLEKALRWPIR